MSALKYWDSTSGTWKTVGTAGGATPAPTKVVYLTGSGTYTPSANVRALLVECIAGGGGGGQALAATSQVSAGSGGGGGAYAAKYLSGTLKSSYAYAAGIGGVHNPPVAGSDTTFDSPSVCTAKGGQPGVAGVSSATPAWQPAGGLGGLSSSGVGDMLSDGEVGQPGMRLSGTQGKGGDGGGSIFGMGSRGSFGAGTPIMTAAVGGGGAGALSNSTASFWGNPGAAGIIKVTEFF